MNAVFDLFLGIDYSGARSPTCRLKKLQVYAAKPGAQPEKLYAPVSSNNKMPWNWLTVPRSFCVWLITANQKS